MEKNNRLNFLITGGTGFIGSKLVDKILSLGNSVTVLTRKTNLKSSKNLQYINKIGEEFDYDIVINLCGEPISCRWSKSKKVDVNFLVDEMTFLTTLSKEDLLSELAARRELIKSHHSLENWGSSIAKIINYGENPAELTL